MPWYAYKRGGWEIAVDAVSQHDAAQHIKRAASGAEYQGEFSPPHAYTTMTAMVTARREQAIHDALEREYQAWLRAGRPGAWWDAPEGGA
jgi:hypothetical protein